jgi:ribosomal protein L17
MFRINTRRILAHSKLFENFLLKDKSLGQNFFNFDKFHFSEDKKGKGAKGGKPEKTEQKDGKNKGEKNKSAAQDDKSKGKEQLPQKNEKKQVTEENTIFSKAEVFRKKTPLKNEKYEVTHNYEKVSSVPEKQKKSLENLVTQLLRNEEITTKRAQEIKQEIRDPLNNAYGRHLTKIESRADAYKYIKNFSDLFFYHRTFDSLDRLIKYQRELHDEKDPAYIQLRSQHKLATYDNMNYPVPQNVDVRQNVNSPDWLKTQPRQYSVGYSYNTEENKEFHKNFEKYVEIDKKKVLEKQKLLKYIKLNPNNQQVKLRFIPQHLPDGVTPEMIPDYDVDINGYKPDITKKSRRIYKEPRVDTNFKNYEAWRTFDRVFHAFDVDSEFLKVELIPKYLINVNLNYIYKIFI